MLAKPLSRTEARFLERAREAIRGGRLDVAGSSLDNVLALAPDCLEAVRLAGVVAQMRNDHARAIGFFNRALAADPGDIGASVGIGISLFERGDFEAAVKALQHAGELAPDAPSVWYNLGKALKLQTQTAAAIEALQRAVQLDPRHAMARLTLADAQASVGDVDAAVANLRQVLKQDPRQAHAWFALANLKVEPLSVDDAVQLRRALEASDLPRESRILLGFALAKALEDGGDYAGAFDVLGQANALQRSLVRWDPAAYRQRLQAIEAAFSAPLPEPLDPGLGREVILIVGVPRSGSSLLEQILASHPEVQGANEITDLPDVIQLESRRRGLPFPQWVGEATAQDWLRLGKEYLARTQRWRRERPRFTDKNLVTWELVGAARAMLPAARLVDCHRDPLEAGLACYRQWFVKGAEFSYDLGDIADYLIEYRRLMRFWQRRFPQCIFDLSYESLLEQPRAVIGQLLEFCGLPFDPACLDFHRTRRTVMSAASAAQVRQPLRRNGSRSALFGEGLDSLRRRLREAGL